jgi:hypothetical protein
MSSYEDMLAQAKAAKQDGKRSIPPVKTPPPIRRPDAVQSSDAVVKKPSSRPANGAPFSDEMYDHLKFVLEKLAARMKSDKPLSVADMKKMEISINAIISDFDEDVSVSPVLKQAVTPAAAPQQRQKIPLPVRKSPPPPRASGQNTPKVVPYELGTEPAGFLGPPDESSPFSLLHGHRSYWEIEDMEKMDTETFYQKINERQSAMKVLRKGRGERIGSQASEEYFKFLSEKKQVHENNNQ